MSPPGPLLRKLCNRDVQCQTTLTVADLNHIEQHCNDLKRMLSVLNQKVTQNVALNEDFFRDDNRRVLFYTGIPTFALLMDLFNLISHHIPVEDARRLSKFQEMTMFLSRLRLNLHIQDLAYRMNTDAASVSKIFNKWLNGTYQHMEYLVQFPEQRSVLEIFPIEIIMSFNPRLKLIPNVLSGLKEPSVKQSVASTSTKPGHNPAIVHVVPQRDGQDQSMANTALTLGKRSIKEVTNVPIIKSPNNQKPPNSKTKVLVPFNPSKLSSSMVKIVPRNQGTATYYVINSALPIKSKPETVSNLSNPQLKRSNQLINAKETLNTAKLPRLMQPYISMQRLESMQSQPISGSNDNTQQINLTTNKPVVLLLELFEILIRKPSKSEDQEITWAEHKQCHTLKFILCLAMNRQIVHVSKAFGGSCSNIYVLEKCGIVEQLEKGDILVSLAKFNDKSKESFTCAEVYDKTSITFVNPSDIPNLDKLKEFLKKLASPIRNRYGILQHFIPVDFILGNGSSFVFVDRMIGVSCAFINFCLKSRE